MVHMCDRVYVICVWVGEGWVELKYVTDKLLVSIKYARDSIHHYNVFGVHSLWVHVHAILRALDRDQVKLTICMDTYTNMRLNLRV